MLQKMAAQVGIWAITATMLSACNNGVRNQQTNLEGVQGLPGNSENWNYNDPFVGVNPTENLFSSPTTASSEAPVSSTDSASIFAADAQGQACMASDYGQDSSQQWACLAAQGQNGPTSQEAIFGLATSNIRLMHECGLAVRQFLIWQMQSMHSAHPDQVRELFRIGKVKMTECYYRVTQMQADVLPWAPYQAQVYNHNAGNLWNLLQGFLQ